MKPSEIMRQLQLLPKKSFGQNFLIDEKVLTDIIEASGITSEDTVVEIGPGLGVLTFELARRAKRVIAIEADRDMVDYLRPKLPKNVDLLSGDALRVDWDVTITGSYKLVANIPYSITSPLLRKIFLLKNKPAIVILLVQKELADRINAPAGRSDRGFLTLLTEASAAVKIVRAVKPGSFYPMPKVESAIIGLKPYPINRMEEIFWPAVEAGFRHKRQTLANSLKDLMISKDESAQILEKCGLDAMIRPQVLTFDDWVKASKIIKERL